MPVNPCLVSHSLVGTAQISYRCCSVSRAGNFLHLSRAFFLRTTHQFNLSFIGLLDSFLRQAQVFLCLIFTQIGTGNDAEQIIEELRR